MTSLPPAMCLKIRREHVPGATAPGECWVWTGHCDQNGYGRITVNGRNCFTHRVVYEMLVGPVPEGLESDHLCRVRNCCRPAHLEPVTHHVNVLRGEKATRTRCIYDHPLSGDNLYIRVRKNGARERTCRACQGRRAAKRAARLAAAA